MTPSHDEIALYVMGEYDGDRDYLEAAIAGDPKAQSIATHEASFELLLREAANAATFCPACRDLVMGNRCDARGAAVAPGGYRVERVLVSNAHGRMYAACDADGKQVALKELAFVQAPQFSTVDAFEREAKFLRALEHPAIPRFVASFAEGSGVHTRYYLAQELVAGETLDQRLDDHWFTESEIIDIARQVLEVLVYLQGLSPMVIHRDIKPANLIMRTDDSIDTPHRDAVLRAPARLGLSIAVVDFGAAHVQGTTVGSTTIGTFGYMPVEQLAGVVDATTDVYALGASLLNLLVRREPWRILQGTIFDGVNVSPAMRAYLAKLVAADSRDRFPNAAAALVGLDEVTRAAAAPRRRRAGWLPRLAIAASVLAGGATATIAMWPDAEQTESAQPTALGDITLDPTIAWDRSRMLSLTDTYCNCTDDLCKELALDALQKELANSRYYRWPLIELGFHKPPCLIPASTVEVFGKTLKLKDGKATPEALAELNRELNRELSDEATAKGADEQAEPLNSAVRQHARECLSQLIRDIGEAGDDCAAVAGHMNSFFDKCATTLKPVAGVPDAEGNVEWNLEWSDIIPLFGALDGTTCQDNPMVEQASAPLRADVIGMLKSR